MYSLVESNPYLAGSMLIYWRVVVSPCFKYVPSSNGMMVNHQHWGCSLRPNSSNTYMDMGFFAWFLKGPDLQELRRLFHIYDFLWTCRDKWGYSSKSIHIPICELIATEFSRIARCLAAVRSGVVNGGMGCRVWGALGDTAGLECKNSLMLI